MEAMPGEIHVCESSALIDGGNGLRFEAWVDGVAEPAFAVRYAGRVHAYVNRCAHIPYELDWQPGKFFDSESMYIMCSTHGALYEPETGRCAGGPCARRGLVRVPVTERNGHVFASAARAASNPNS